MRVVPSQEYLVYLVGVSPASSITSSANDSQRRTSPAVSLSKVPVDLFTEYPSFRSRKIGLWADGSRRALRKRISVEVVIGAKILRGSTP